MKNEKIFITGGAGFLGKNIIKKFYDANDIVIFSRDEAKHYYLKKQFPKIRTIIGDVRDRDLLLRSSEGCSIGIFAASLKQIEAVDQNVEEANKIIIDGAFNGRYSAEKNKMKSACFISSDKSRSATTLYGAMKFIAGESFIVNSDKNDINLSTAIYGNVLNSTGSLIPLIWDSIKNNYQLTLYSDEMTRFMITSDEAVDLIEHSLNFKGFNIIPKIKSFRIKDLFEIFNEKFNLNYKKGVPRISEKLHEIMFSEEESVRTTECSKYYYMHYSKIYNNANIPKYYSSRDYCISKKELNDFLNQYNYFKP
jgi:UDP-glucose 4-epimerase